MHVACKNEFVCSFIDTTTRAGRSMLFLSVGASERASKRERERERLDDDTETEQFVSTHAKTASVEAAVLSRTVKPRRFNHNSKPFVIISSRRGCHTVVAPTINGNVKKTK